MPIKRLLLCMMSACILLLSFTSQKNKRVVFFGDSITELGVKPGGYVTLLQNDSGLKGTEIIGKGVSGNKVYDLYLRLETDVLKLNPTQVVIYIGVNDVWHKSLLGTGTDFDKFSKFYQALIDKIRASGAEPILVTPAVIGELKSNCNPMDKDLDRFSDAIRLLAERNSLRICDLRKIFVDYIEKNNTLNTSKDILTRDGVHLNEKGNELVAAKLAEYLK